MKKLLLTLGAVASVAAPVAAVVACSNDNTTTIDSIIKPLGAELQTRTTPENGSTHKLVSTFGKYSAINKELKGLKFVDKFVDADQGFTRYFFSGTTTTLQTLSNAWGTDKIFENAEDQKLTQAQADSITAFVTVYDTVKPGSGWAEEVISGQNPTAVAALDVLNEEGHALSVIAWIK